MISRLKTLVLLQLRNKLKRYERRSKRIYRTIAVNAVILLIVSVIATLAIYVIKSIFFLPVNEFFAIFILLLTQLISIITSLLGISTDLYHSKDNQILFPMPVKNDEIFLSKMIVYYIQELLRNLFFLVPILVALGYNQKAGFVYYLNIIPITLLLPLISVFAATVLSVPFVYIKNFLRHHNAISAILTVILFGIIFYFVYSLVRLIPVPIRLVQLYNRFIIGLSMFMQKVAQYAFIYRYIGFILYSINPWIHYLWVILITLGLGLLNYLIAKPLYFQLTSSSNENTVKTKKHIRIRESKSMFMTFFRKELIIARRSPNELINDYALLMSLPILMYVTNYIYMGLNRSTIGNYMVLILNVLMVLLVVAGSNTASAASITREGYEFIIFKTAPYDTSKMAWAKMLFNLLFTTLVISISFVLFSLALPQFPKKDILMLAIFTILVNIGHMLWSMQLDILNPKLSEYATSGSLTAHENVKRSLTIGIILALIFTIAAIIAFIIIDELGWVFMLALSAVFLVYRFISFNSYLKAYFIDIEY
jgi:ABC-2 type transport system permease protein